MMVPSPAMRVLRSLMVGATFYLRVAAKSRRRKLTDCTTRAVPDGRATAQGVRSGRLVPESLPVFRSVNERIG
ncbi:MAG: hypothetical protein QOJ64_833 [Acidobacteriota bacterium]|jgi:hypothetical protein|nr:hypothetical protein [Acidobacteriota bacterium]